MESRDSSRDPFLRVSVSKVSGLETLNIAKKWCSKISIIQRFLFVVFAGKKQSKQVGKVPEIRKKFNLEVMTTFFQEISAKCTNFEVSSLGLEFQVSSLGLRIFDEVSVSQFQPGLGLEGYGLDYITALHSIYKIFLALGLLILTHSNSCQHEQLVAKFMQGVLKEPDKHETAIVTSQFLTEDSSNQHCWERNAVRNKMLIELHTRSLWKDTVCMLGTLCWRPLKTVQTCFILNF